MSDFITYLRSGSADVTVEGERVFLRPPRVGDYEEWANLRRKSEAFLRPWEPTWPKDDLTLPAYRRRLRGYWRDMRGDSAYPFFVFEREHGRLVGALTLSSVRRGVAQSASLGYWIGQPHARKGYMTDAVRTLVRHAIFVLMLNRVEAACIPENEASRRLLERCGFVREGFARQYLKINGRWRDHLLFAIVRADLDQTGSN